jgi:glutamate dehydrogenase
VLRDNYAQNLALMCSQAQAPAMLRVHADYLNWLENSGYLVRALEGLPAADTIEERRSAHIGLTRPELAVLLAYAKITTTQAILASPLAEDAFAQQSLTDYFPPVLSQRCRSEIAAHPLRREIIATGLANRLVNMSGSTFVFRMSAETSASVADIVRAHTVARRCFGVDDLWHDIESLDAVVASDVQTALLLGVRQLLDRATRWLVSNARSPLDVDETVARFAPGVAAVLAGLPRWLRDRDAEQMTLTVQRYVGAQVPEAIAARIAALTHGLAALAIVDIALRRVVDQDGVAAVHFVLGEELGLSELSSRIAGLPRDTRWQTLSRAAARDDLEAAHAELTTDVLVSTAAELPADERIEAWKSANALAVARASALITDIVASSDADLAILSVALREVRALAR